MYNLSNVWQSFLEALVRFWENRFQTEENELVYFLKIELEKERAEKAKLLNTVLEFACPKPIEPMAQEENKELKPIGQVHWRVKARELEAQARARRQELDREAKEALTKPVAKVTVEELERELGVNE